MNTEASLFSRMTRLFGAQPALYCFFGLLAGLMGISALSALVWSVTARAGDGPTDPATLWRSMTGGSQVAFILGLVFGLWGPIFLAARATCRITTDHLTGRPQTLASVLSDLVKFAPAAFVYSLMIGLAVMVATTMFIVPGILIAALFALVVPASVIESTGIFVTVKRGVALGGKVFGKVFLLTLASAASIGLLLFLRVIGLDRLLAGFSVALAILRIAVIYIPALLVLVLANICFTLLCLEARQSEASYAPAPVPPPP